MKNTELDTLVAGVSKRAVLPKGFMLWDRILQTNWLKQHQAMKQTATKKPATKTPKVTPEPDYSNAKRITMKRNGLKRTLLVVAPPFPRIGDILTDNGIDWTVTKIKSEKVIAAFEKGKGEQAGKLKLVWPGKV
jgi:hypothetical protein